MFLPTEIAAASGGLVTPILIGVVGSGGVVGAVIALVKLSGDRASSAVSQAQGAAETMQDALEAVERERDYWKGRYEQCERLTTQLIDQLGLRERLDRQDE